MGAAWHRLSEPKKSESNDQTSREGPYDMESPSQIGYGGHLCRGSTSMGCQSPNRVIMGSPSPSG